jgi:hypothetical protein
MSTNFLSECRRPGHTEQIGRRFRAQGAPKILQLRMALN